MPSPYLRAVSLTVSMLFVEVLRSESEAPLRLADARISVAHGLADVDMAVFSDYELGVWDYSNKAVADIRVRLEARLRAQVEPSMGQVRSFCEGPLVRMQHDYLRGLLTVAPIWLGFAPLVLGMPEPVLLDAVVR